VIRIAAVSRDDQERLLLARAFDKAPASWDVTLHESAPDEADVIVCGKGTGVEGSISFDPEAPERLISEITAATQKRTLGRRILVTSATGGNGATTVALHLASFGRACAMETIDPGIRRRLRMPSAMSWNPDPEFPVDRAALPVAPGLRVLLAPRSASMDDAATVAERATQSFPAVYVDCDPLSAKRLLTPGGLCVLVMTPTRPSAEGAREILDSIANGRCAVVVNRVGPGSCMTQRRLEGILGRRISIELSCSAALRDAEDEGTLVTSPISRWLWQLKRLSRALETA
jgi:hypothetical protein